MKFGFVGLGFATQWLHLPALKSLPGCRSVGGVEPDPERAEEWARLDAGPVYGTMEELLGAGPDVVVVATPPDSHARYCLEALAAGAHVICEKPFTPDLAEANEVLEAAARHDRFVAVNHEFRFMPIFSAVDRAVGEPRVGRAVFLHCTQFMDLAPWDEKVPWRAAMKSRSLLEGGVHLVDLLHMIVGRLPEAVYAATTSGLDSTSEADAIHLVTLDYGRGVLGQITIDRLCKAGTRYVDLRVDCEEASLRASFGGRAFVRLGVKRAERPGIRLDFGLEGLAWAEQGLKRRVLARNPRQATQKATRALYASTISALERGVEPPTTARIARDTLRVIRAAYQSADTGERIELPASRR